MIAPANTGECPPRAVHGHRMVGAVVHVHLVIAGRCYRYTAAMQMTPERWEWFRAYSQEVFGAEDGHLAGIMAEAVARGMPDISVGPDVGRLLMIMTTLTPGRVALEIGTLAGYSGIWIARGLRDGGRLITIENDPNHAAFAREQFKRAGVADRVELREGAALKVLPDLAAELGASSLDLTVIDAVKSEYPDYWTHVRPLIAPGGVVLADNVLGGKAWWVADSNHPEGIQIDRFNRMVASDSEFEASLVPLRAGILIARRR